MPEIHPTAIIDGDVTMADDVVVGPHCVLSGPITLGAGTRLIGNVYLHGPLTMGAGNLVYPFACLGFAPQHAKYDPETPGLGLDIGNRNTFREHVTVHRAYTDEGPTRVGDGNVFMANAHLGHDAQVGNDCMFVNATLIGGHATIEDRVTMAGGSGVHQFCRVGRGAMFAGLTATTNDVLPWFIHTANNICGAVNLVGLRRHGFDSHQIDEVRWVYRLICRGRRPLPKLIEELREHGDSPIIAEYLQFLERSNRPICTARGKSARGSS